MSRFRFSALLVLSLGVVAMLMLRRDRREPVFVAPSVPAPPEPVVAAEPEPVAEVPQPAAPVQQLYPETDGVSDVAPEPGYWSAPVAPPAHWSDEPPQFGERHSA